MPQKFNAAVKCAKNLQKPPLTLASKFSEFFARNAPHIANFAPTLIPKMHNSFQRSLHIFCGRCARAAHQNRAGFDTKSRDFRSKPAHFGAKNARKQPTITLKTCADAEHHLRHIQNLFGVPHAPAARLLYAKTLQKSVQTRAIFFEIFVRFSREPHRTFKICLLIYSTRCIGCPQ